MLGPEGLSFQHESETVLAPATSSQDPLAFQARKSLKKDHQTSNLATLATAALVYSGGPHPPTPVQASGKPAPQKSKKFLVQRPGSRMVLPRDRLRG